MPQLVRFLMRHALIGIGVAVLFVGTLVAFDVARLGTLVTQSPSGLVAVVALTCAVGITFGSVQMGFAVMLLAGEEEKPGGGRTAPARVSRLKPALARVRARIGRADPHSRLAQRS